MFSFPSPFISFPSLVPFRSSLRCLALIPPQPTHPTHPLLSREVGNNTGESQGKVYRDSHAFEYTEPLQANSVTRGARVPLIDCSTEVISAAAPGSHREIKWTWQGSQTWYLCNGLCRREHEGEVVCVRVQERWGRSYMNIVIFFFFWGGDGERWGAVKFVFFVFWWFFFVYVKKSNHTMHI